MPERRTAKRSGPLKHQQRLRSARELHRIRAIGHAARDVSSAVWEVFAVGLLSPAFKDAGGQDAPLPPNQSKE